jgi:hypothetical protein
MRLHSTWLTREAFTFSWYKNPGFTGISIDAYLRSTRHSTASPPLRYGTRGPGFLTYVRKHPQIRAHTVPGPWAANRDIHMLYAWAWGLGIQIVNVYNAPLGATGPCVSVLAGTENVSRRSHGSHCDSLAKGDMRLRPMLQAEGCAPAASRELAEPSRVTKTTHRQTVLLRKTCPERARLEAAFAHFTDAQKSRAVLPFSRSRRGAWVGGIAGLRRRMPSSGYHTQAYK